MKTKIIIAMFLLFLLTTNVNALTIRSANVFPTEIEPGKTARVSMTIINSLNEDIEDISISLDLSDLPFAPYDSSNEAGIDELSEDEEETIGLEIIALSNAEAGIYKIPITMTYLDESGIQRQKDSLISLTVNSKPILSVKNEDGLLLKNSKNEVSVKVVNKGLSEAKFLEIEIENTGYYDLLSENIVYIGDIESDDFDVADFQVYFKENIPTIINMPVTLRYKDVVNNAYEEEYTISLKVYTQEKAIELGLINESKTSIYVGIAILLIIFYLVYSRIKKRRKLKKSSN